VGDFNGDGLQDLAVLGTDHSITFSLSNREGTSRQASGLLDPTFAYWATQPDVQLVTADFHGSGFSDLAIIGPFPGVYVEAANGDGTYTFRANYMPAFGAQSPYPTLFLSVGDFNGDGLQDLAVLGTDHSITV